MLQIITDTLIIAEKRTIKSLIRSKCETKTKCCYKKDEARGIHSLKKYIHSKK